jgi:tetrahydromethanopterin S-methyltransferase subunit G
MTTNTSIDALYIVDDEYKDVASVISKKGHRVQEIWEAYLKLSGKIVGEDGSIAGSRAKAYSDFISVSKELLFREILRLTSECSREYEAYISKIDEADSALY